MLRLSALWDAGIQRCGVRPAGAAQAHGTGQAAPGQRCSCQAHRTPAHTPGPSSTRRACWCPWERLPTARATPRGPFSPRWQPRAFWPMFCNRGGLGMRPFILLDLYSQAKFIPQEVRAWPRQRVLAWLRQYGDVREWPVHAGDVVLLASEFRAPTGLTTTFMLADDGT